MEKWRVHLGDFSVRIVVSRSCGLSGSKRDWKSCTKALMGFVHSVQR